MHSDPKLTERMERADAARGLEWRIMFGGASFFHNGNFCCGVYHDKLVLRVGVDEAEKALKKKHVRVMDITGAPMRGWIMIEPAGCKTKAQLERWINLARTFIDTLPIKKRKPKP